MPSASQPRISTPATDVHDDEKSTRSFEVSYAAAQRFLDDGENQRAIDAFSEALKANGRASVAYNGRGVAALRLQRLASALDDFDKAINLEPSEAKYYANRSLVHSDKQDFQSALEDLSQAVRLQPTAPEWREARGKLYYAMQQTALADKEMQAAKALRAGSLKGQPSKPDQVNAPISEHVQNEVDHAPFLLPLRDLTDDIREFLRLSNAEAAEFNILLAEYEDLLGEAYDKLDPSIYDPVYNAYSQAHRIYVDSADVWRVSVEAHQLLEDAETEWRNEIERRTLAYGETDNSDLVEAIASYKYIIKQGHAPNTRYPGNTTLVSGLTGVVERYPELAGEFHGYHFIKRRWRFRFFAFRCWALGSSRVAVRLGASLCTGAQWTGA